MPEIFWISLLTMKVIKIALSVKIHFFPHLNSLLFRQRLVLNWFGIHITTALITSMKCRLMYTSTKVKVRGLYILLVWQCVPNFISKRCDINSIYMAMRLNLLSFINFSQQHISFLKETKHTRYDIFILWKTFSVLLPARQICFIILITCVFIFIPIDVFLRFVIRVLLDISIRRAWLLKTVFNEYGRREHVYCIDLWIT